MNDNYPIPGLTELPCGCTGVGDRPRSKCNAHANEVTANRLDYERLQWLRLRTEGKPLPWLIHSNTDGDFLKRCAEDESA